VPVPPPRAHPTATPARVVAPAFTDVTHHRPNATGRAHVGSLQRRRVGLLASAAFFAVLVAGLAVVVAMGEFRDGASNTTNPTVASPTRGSASQPSAGPTLGAPTTTVTVPNPPGATRPATGTPATITQQMADTFVRSYYDAVAAGNYEASWAQLAPEFQRGMARSYQYYVGFWSANDVEVGEVRLVEAGEDRVIVNVELSWNGDAAVVNEFTLRPGADGDLVISSQSALGGG